MIHLIQEDNQQAKKNMTKLTFYYKARLLQVKFPKAVFKSVSL
jgi:hypothetical protein